MKAKYTLLTEAERDSIHAQLAEAAQNIMAQYMGADMAQNIAEHEGETIETVWQLSDIMADLIDWNIRRQMAADIAAEMHLPYDDDRIERIADAIAQNWDNAETVKAKIRNGQLQV